MPPYSDGVATGLEQALDSRNGSSGDILQMLGQYPQDQTQTLFSRTKLIPSNSPVTSLSAPLPSSPPHHLPSV